MWSKLRDVQISYLMLSNLTEGLRMKCRLKIIINDHIRRDRGKRIMCFTTSHILLTKRFTHNNEKLWRNQDDCYEQ